MKIIQIHNPKQSSPYFEALNSALGSIGIDVEVSADLPKRFSNSEKNIVVFHRLGRFLQMYETPEEALDAIMQCKSLGYSFAWTIHNFIPLEMNNDKEIQEIKGFLPLFISKMDYLLSHTEEMGWKAKNIFSASNVYNTGYGIDYHLTGSYENKVAVGKNNEFTFLMIGHMRDYKGIEDLVLAFNEIHSRYPLSRLILAGPQYKGFVSNNLQAQVMSPGITYIDKFIYQNEYEHLLRISDVMVFPYKVHDIRFQYGFFSSSIPEAAYSGKYMILPNCASISSILGTLEYSCVYQPNCLNNLINAMNDVILMKRCEIKKSEKELQKIIKKHTWENVAKAIMQVFSGQGHDFEIAGVGYGTH